MLKDIYNIIPNDICFSINLSNTLIWCYFYYSRDKKEEKDEKEKPVKGDEEEH